MLASPALDRRPSRLMLRALPARPGALVAGLARRQDLEIGLMQGGCGRSISAATPSSLTTFTRPGRAISSARCLSALNAGQLPASFVILVFAARLAGRKTPLDRGRPPDLRRSRLLFSAGPGRCVGLRTHRLLRRLRAHPDPCLAAASRPPDDVHRLSAGMFTIGYSVSFFAAVCPAARPGRDGHRRDRLPAGRHRRACCPADGDGVAHAGQPGMPWQRQQIPSPALRERGRSKCIAEVEG